MYQQDKLFLVETPAPAPFTPDLPGLVRWLETQDPARTYNWNDCHGACLMDEFARASGVNCWYGIGGHCHEVPFNGFQVAGIEPWTCGAALLRAKALLNGR